MASKAETYSQMLRMRMAQRRQLVSDDITELSTAMTGIEARIARLQRKFTTFESGCERAAPLSGATVEAE